MSLIVRALVLLVLLPVSVFGAEQQENRARLEQIRQRIEQTSKSLEAQQQQELSLLRDLAVINTSLQEIDRRIVSLQRQQREGEKKIKVVRTEINQGKQELRQQERRLQKRLTALYKEGNTGTLKVLFSAESPMELAEQYEYLSRILAHDKEMMAEFREVLTQQQSRLARIEKLQQQQEKRLNDEKAERVDARSARKLQAQLLSKVRNNKSQLNAELQSLQEKARRLEDLVNQLGRQKDNSGQKFAALKGRLPWPLPGTLLVGFGTQKNPEFGALYESRGIEIAASKGAKIRAVAPGTVVFASWFKGYGNLLIVAHDGGYHTLYAQADSLLKDIGERVEAGEPVALVGLPGAQGGYFEIRHNGAPVNPLTWLVRK